MFTIDLPPAADGRRRQMNRKGFVSQQAAQTAEAEARKAYARADLAADGTLAAELEVWLGERELDVQQTTLSNYRDIVNCYIVPHLGSRQVYALPSGPSTTSTRPCSTGAASTVARCPGPPYGRSTGY